MLERLGVFTHVIANHLPLAAELVFIGDQTIETHRSARVQLSGADADLRAETITESV